MSVILLSSKQLINPPGPSAIQDAKLNSLISKSWIISCNLKYYLEIGLTLDIFRDLLDDV